MNKKAIQLAISTLIIIILGIFLLISLIYIITGGFKSLKQSTDPFLDNEAMAIKAKCEQDCQNNIKLSYCCNNYPYHNQEINCTDTRLEINCNINCEDFSCE